MPDMLVRLYDLPETSSFYKKLEEKGIRILRPMTPNKSKVLNWIRENFDGDWADEVSTAFSHTPVSCFIAYDTNEREILGFAAYDCTYRNFFGPTGVAIDRRGNGIGKALFLRCLEAMRDEGYAYAIVGSVGPVNFYEKTVSAVMIDGSDPSIYKDLI
ncbi:MAG: GNAT family N-acetyltransferase [Clostridia bacterium]|nr:GNAT family N-acetyltransferase [Clostridia bacterium]